MITFVELRVVAGRSRTRAGRPHAVSGQPMLIHPCHAMPMLQSAVALRSRIRNGMVVAWHGRGMACVNQTWPHCVNQIGKTQSKPLAARRGRGTAWERHGMCELAFSDSYSCQAPTLSVTHLLVGLLLLILHVACPDVKLRSHSCIVCSGSEAFCLLPKMLNHSGFSTCVLLELLTEPTQVSSALPQMYGVLFKKY
jgi:hypothetical protein